MLSLNILLSEYLQNSSDFVFKIIASFPVVNMKLELWLAFGPEFFQTICFWHITKDINDALELFGQWSSCEFIKFFRSIFFQEVSFQTLLNNFFLDFSQFKWTDYLLINSFFTFQRTKFISVEWFNLLFLIHGWKLLKCLHSCLQRLFCIWIEKMKGK